MAVISLDTHLRYLRRGIIFYVVSRTRYLYRSEQARRSVGGSGARPLLRLILEMLCGGPTATSGFAILLLLYFSPWNLRTCVSRLKSQISSLSHFNRIRIEERARERESERVKVAALLSCNHGSGMACLGDISGGRGGV